MKLTTEELAAIVRGHLDNALGSEDGELSNERAEALDRYHGRPFGDEIEGRSQVVTKDLSETIGWAMPALMRVFFQSGDIVEFDPVGPEDEELAKQESDYTNHVLMKDNPGFMLLHDAIHDALLLKNGYVKHWWDESEETFEEEYEGLTEDELAQLILNHEAEGHSVDVAEQEEITIMADGFMLTGYNVKLSITKKRGKVCVEAVPPEEIRVSKRARGSTQDAPFVAHVTRKTRSELIEMGMDRDWVESLPAYNEEDNDQEVIARDSVGEHEDELSLAYDRSMDEIEYCEAYLRVDWDGDGIAELRKVVTCAEKIPPGSEWNERIDRVPITSLVAKRIPHRHIGESFDDELADLQRIHTVLTRQLLDNLYLVNNSEVVINRRHNLNDWMRRVPGGMKRVNDDAPVAGSYEYLQTPPIINQVLPAIDWLTTVKENRTGVSRVNTGMNPDILQETTKGAFMENLNKASQKIEMIARMLAETGIKELVLRVHELLIKHQDQERIVKLRGKYIPVNPQNWRDRTDLSIRVGLGTGSEEEKRQQLMMLVDLQVQAEQMGLVGPQQAFNMFSDIAETIGTQNPDKYVMDPTSPEFQQRMQSQSQGEPQSNPLAEVEMIKQQAMSQRDQMQMQIKAQLEMAKAEREQQAEMMKLQFEAMQAQLERQSKENIEAAKLELRALIDANKNIDLGKPGIGAGLGDGGGA